MQGHVPPRIDLLPMDRNEENFAFALAAKKEALGPYVIPKWGWDDEAQRRILEEHWEARNFRRIVVDGQAAGTVSMEEKPGEWFFSDFYLFNAFQRRGIGGEVLSRFLADAARVRVPVTLKVIKWNPARSLYERHGFAVTGETETHYLMRWQG